MPREPDLAFEALVEVTHSVVEMERGQLNVALKAIRGAWEREGGLPEDLPKEIAVRADAYRSMWPTLTLTPTALARHWHRVIAQKRTPQQRAIDELRREGFHQN